MIDRLSRIACCSIAALLLVTASASAATSKPVPLKKGALTELKFAAPHTSLITGKRVRVVVKMPGNVKSFRAITGGKVISSRFVVRGSTRVAVLPVGKILRRGVNHVNVLVTTKGGNRSAGDLRLIVAARGKKPATASIIRQRTRVLAQIKLSDTAEHFVVKLNGRTITKAFSRFTTKKQSIPLAPDEGLRFGVNRFSVTAALKNGRFLRKTVRFDVARTRPLASAGKDRRARAGDTLKLNAGRTITTSGKAGLHWRVKQVPKGAKATLKNSNDPRPLLRVSQPGTYKVELSATSRGRRGTDVVTLSALPNVPPIGASVRTLAPQPGGGYAIEVAKNCIGGNAACGKIVSPFTEKNPVQILVLNRADLSFNRVVPLTASQDDALAALLVLNSLAGTGDQVDYICILAAAPGTAAYSGYKLAVEELTGSTTNISQTSGWSAIGVPNQNFDSSDNVTGFVNDGNNPGRSAVQGELTGNFSFDPVEQIMTYNPSQAFDYQTSTGSSTPTKNFMDVAGALYPSAPLSAGCTGGFQLVTVRSTTLTAPASLPVNQTFDSNCANVGIGEIGLLNLDAAIQAAATASPTDADGPLLVFLQSIGPAFPASPSQAFVIGATGIAQQIESLGGTGDTFMSATNNAAKGYALAGGTTLRSEAPPLALTQTYAPEASDLQPGSGYTLSGLLQLSRFAHFQPRSGSPTASRIGRLNAIAYQAPTPWPYSSTKSQKNALAYISRHYDIEYSPSSSCYKPAVPDVRFEYCDLNAPWSNLLANLPSHKWSAADCGCIESDWKSIRKEIPKEIRSVQRVYKYVALVQQIYGNGSGESSILGVKNIATQINNAINPPAGSGAGGWWSDLVANLANGLSVLAPADSTLEAVSDAVSAIAYLGEDALTVPNGSSTLGQIVSTEASELPQQAADRYRAASLNFGHFGDMIVTDAGKLKAVAASTDIQLDENALTDSAGQMMVGAYRFAYKQMLASAYDTLSLAPNSYSTTATTPNQYGCFIEKNDPKTAQYPFQNAGAATWVAMQRNGPQLPVFGNVAPWFLIWGKRGDTNIFNLPSPPQKDVQNLAPAITFNGNGIPQTFGEYMPWMMRKNFTQVPMPCISQ